MLRSGLIRSRNGHVMEAQPPPGKSKSRPSPAPKSRAGKTDPFLRRLREGGVEEVELDAGLLPGALRGPDAGTLRTQARARWWGVARTAAGAVSLALIAVVAGLATRTAWPVDETRFLAIAWEMWSQHDLLVPRLNGVPAPVAPLFFWAVQGGWSLFGPGEWWARSVPALFMLGSLFFAARMARSLWPGQASVSRYLPFVLLGTFYWVWSATFFTPGMATVFFTLFALFAILRMWRTRDQRMWLLLGLALGLGMLASGSLILIYVLPVALLAPLWTRGTPVMPWKYWYADLGKAGVMAFVIFAAWFLPAAARAKAAAVTPVLMSPLATQTLDLFSAARPQWWPVLLLPFLALPWSFWPLPWTRFFTAGRGLFNHGMRFCFFWAASTVALLVLARAGQPQFLLPLIPAVALPVAWLLLDASNETAHDSHLSTMIFPLMLLGGLLAVLPKLPRVPLLPEFLWQLSPFVGVAVIGIGIAVGLLPLPDLRSRIRNLATIATMFTAFVLMAAGYQFNAHMNVSEAAQKIDIAQRAGRGVAIVGDYNGEFQFAGKLTRPIEKLAPEQVEAWLAGHSDGLLVTLSTGWQPRTPAPPDYEQALGEGRLRLWQVATLNQK